MDYEGSICFVWMVPFEGMRKFKFRTVKDVHDGAEEVSIPTQPFKFEVTEKSRTSDLCPTLCSSCMHFERVAAIVGVATGDFTDKASETKRASLCSSFNGVLLSPSLNSASDCRQLTSSEASNNFSVSLSHDSLSENAKSQATSRDSDPCENIALLLKLTNGQSPVESGHPPKGLTNFDYQRFSNQFEKDQEIKILGDNISSISRSNSTNLTIASTPFELADGNYHDVQNFAEEPPLAGVALPSILDQSDVSCLEDFCNSAISLKGESSECSSEQVESSLARAVTSGLSGQIDSVYRVDPHLNCEDPAVETESPTSCKKHPHKSDSVIDKNTMQEYRQSQPVNSRGVSDLFDNEVRVCDTCGDAGREELLALCIKCTDGAAHIYCMRVKLDKVPEGDWTCEECMLRIETEKAVQDKVEEAFGISKGHLECQKSSSSSKLKFRPSSAGRNGMTGVSSTSQLSAKRLAVPVEAQPRKRARVVGMSAVPPRLSKPSNSSPLCADISGKSLKKGKMKSAKGVTSVPQFPSDSQKKVNIPRACGDKRHAGILEAELEKKSKGLETRVVSSKASKSSKSKFSEKEKVEATDSVASVKQSSFSTQGKAESFSILGDKSPKRGSQSGISQHKCSLLKPRSSKALDLKLKGQLAKGSCLQKQKVVTNGAYDGCKKGKDSRIVSKSPSLKNVSSNKSNATDLEVLLASASCPDALNKLCYAKETMMASRRATDSEGHLASASCPVALKKLSCANETKTDKRNETSDLHIPAIPASDSCVISVQGEKEAEFGDKTSLSGSTCNNFSSNKSNATDLAVLLASASRPDALNKLSYAKEKTAANRRATDSEGHLASASCPVSLKKLSCAKETKTDKRIETSDLHIPAIPASDSGVISVQGEKETESGDKTSLSGPIFHKVDAVQSCGQLNFKLKPSWQITLNDLNCANEEERNPTWKDESPKEAATPVEKYKLCTDLARDEISSGTNLVPYEAAILSQGCVIPMPDYIWLGQFLILSNERLANFCDGVQAHLSTCASPKVLEVVDKLPKMIKLDELPRLGMWPSQFMESHAAEENIALYFFAEDLDSYRTYYRRLLEHMADNDLALKGNLDGFELLIFPSNVLPENCQRWNQLLFLWGVFRGRKVINSANVQMTNSKRQQNGDSEKKQTWDLNAYPQDAENIARDDEVSNSVGEVHEIDNTGVSFTEERIFLDGNGYGSGLSDPRQAVDEGENRSESEVVDLDLSLWPKSATPSDGIVENKTSTEVHCKLLMDDNNSNADNEEPSGSSSNVQNLELLERQAVEILVSLSKGFRKF